MKFDWEEIWSSESLPDSVYWQVTYRAKVFGGWLLRHETCCDYQYKDREFNPEALHKYVDEEGYQDIKNVITFVADHNHHWGITED